MRWTLWMFMAGTLVLVMYVEGVANPFSYWNSWPIILAGAVWYRVERRRERPGERARRASYLAAGFAAFTTAATMLVHLAWWFDWGGTATGSSTAGMVFVIAPLAVLVVACAGMIAGRLIHGMFGSSPESG